MSPISTKYSRVLSRTQKYDHITPVLASLHWLPVVFRINFKIVLLVFKSLNGLVLHHHMSLSYSFILHFHSKYNFSSFWLGYIYLHCSEIALEHSRTVSQIYSVWKRVQIRESWFRSTSFFHKLQLGITAAIWL